MNSIPLGPPPGSGTTPEGPRPPLRSRASLYVPANLLVLAWFVQTPGQLTWLAVLLALVLGGVQSVIRATIAVQSPRGRFGATFGLMQVGTKLAGCAASLVFGGMYAATGHSRSGLVTLLAQLLVGWWVLARRKAA